MTSAEETNGTKLWLFCSM